MSADQQQNIDLVPSKILLLAHGLLHCVVSFSVLLSALPQSVIVILLIGIGIHLVVSLRRCLLYVHLIMVNHYYVLQHGEVSGLLLDVYYQSSYLIILRCQFDGRIRYYPLLKDMCSQKNFHFLSLYARDYLPCLNVK